VSGVVLTLLVTAGLIALVVWLVRRAYTQRNVGIEFNAALPWAPQDATGHVLAQLTGDMQRWRYRLTNQGPAALVFSYRYRPGWLISPCVLLFPIGLLFLIYTKTVEISFAFAADTRNHSEVSVVGQGPPYIRGRIADVLLALESGPVEPASSSH
jgi:hypothetical protein